MARGGSRPGAGRKTKAEELELPALIEAVIGAEGKRTLIERIFKRATSRAGSYKHQELLMAYIYGKPADKVQVSGSMKMHHHITGMIVK